MSKHSLGALVGIEVSHAQMGEKWLDRHLERKGKSKEDFAKRLWDENITAVAEVSPPVLLVEALAQEDPVALRRLI